MEFLPIYIYWTLVKFNKQAVLPKLKDCFHYGLLLSGKTQKTYGNILK